RHRPVRDERGVRGADAGVRQGAGAGRGEGERPRRGDRAGAPDRGIGGARAGDAAVRAGAAPAEAPAGGAVAGRRQRGGDGRGAQGVSMSLDEAYPKASRKDYPRLRRLLECVPDLGQKEREEIADTLNDMANLASDLSDIVRRLRDEEHTPAE